jgi:hypothetical protein
VSSLTIVNLALYRRLAADDYLADLAHRPVADLRAMRSECQSVEEEVSMARRVVQGRLDIVRHEFDLRRHGGEPSDASQLVGSLAVALTELDHGGPAVSTSGVVDEFEVIDELLADEALANLPGCTDAELDSIHDRLHHAEQILSVRRRRLFDRIDQLAEELTRRYRTGEASIDSLLG